MHGPSLVRAHKPSTPEASTTYPHVVTASRNPSRLSKHDDLITANTCSVAVASEACALVATTNNIVYRAPLRLLLRDE